LPAKEAKRLKPAKYAKDFCLAGKKTTHLSSFALFSRISCVSRVTGKLNVFLPIEEKKERIVKAFPETFPDISLNYP
jgi:hypothetical protein